MESFLIVLFWVFVAIIALVILFLIFLMWRTNVIDTGRQSGFMPIGKIGFAASKIRKKGKVEVDGEYWRAFSQDDIDLVKGEKVVVISAEGFRLGVRRADDINSKADLGE
tara:strand:+ start:74 stop:403 length:330 start_codon:yes stop_codon:yes gene_type:complete